MDTDVTLVEARWRFTRRGPDTLKGGSIGQNNERATSIQSAVSCRLKTQMTTPRFVGGDR